MALAEERPISKGCWSTELILGETRDVKVSFAVPTIPKSSGTFSPCFKAHSSAPRAEKSPEE